VNASAAGSPVDGRRRTTPVTDVSALRAAGWSLKDAQMLVQHAPKVPGSSFVTAW
jgi:hypothetical protein